MLEDILVPIFGMLTTFGSAFGICYVYFSTRHKERMALIDHGADPSIFKTESNPMKVLKWGLFFVGIGLGILGGIGLVTGWRLEPPVPIYIAMILIGGGLGLMIFYLIQYKMEKKKS